MHKTILTALATATICSAALLFAGRAEAMTAAAPAAAGAPTASLVREAAIICGGNGCNPVPTKTRGKRKFKILGHG
jgi:hypothetical protein